MPGLVPGKPTAPCSDLDPKVTLLEEDGQWVLHLTPGPALQQAHTTFVTTKLLG
jgi:hypothetical protein